MAPSDSRSVNCRGHFACDNACERRIEQADPLPNFMNAPSLMAAAVPKFSKGARSSRKVVNQLTISIKVKMV
jgi:hypothetical protein